MLRVGMHEFYISTFKSEWDEAAHLFCNLFPLGIKVHDTYTSKELSLKQGICLADGLIAAKKDVVQHLMFSSSNQARYALEFGDLVSLSTTFIQEGVVALKGMLANRKKKRKRNNKKFAKAT
ncbi:hypothetical protein GOP47_0004532 [Adiantum capillus-veneris]|uniref:Uncharacterized protein n=1 Tax=Adiantum capillus-veneris TaxID=13818 RepID=A0A9D4V895_ADICA|nr:hypothetical protein GOP47_0004532 [Adiantum capillus-veneris]